MLCMLHLLPGWKSQGQPLTCTLQGHQEAMGNVRQPSAVPL